MNWLTVRMAELPSFGNLHGSASPLSGTNLRRLPLRYVIDALGGIGVEMHFDGLEGELNDAHVYTEDSSSAAQRAESAQVANLVRSAGEEPFLFTTALDDGTGAVLYLPDNDTDDQDVQLFTDEQYGPIGRLQLSGQLTPTSAYLSQANRRVIAGNCNDGPCKEENWGEGCGDGCTCEKFPDVAFRADGRLRRRLRFPGVRAKVSVFRCCSDN